MEVKKILIVEDDAAVGRGLQKLLENENYTVAVQNNGIKGLNEAKNGEFDLLILDLMLPGVSGFEICRELRMDGCDLPIIMLTARKDQVDKIVGLELGADDYITKPFDGREVLARVKSALRRTPEKSGRNYSRRLSAIMFTDIKDYSKKMNNDEIGALQLLSQHNTMMKGAIKKFNGNIIEIIGDAFLVTFNSCVEAVECGISIQDMFTEYNSDTDDLNKIEIRMGIHLGDIIEYEGKIKGDAVNIAARIEEHSEAGKVTISEDVNNLIRNKIELKTKSLGEYKFKNIDAKIKLYSIIINEQDS